MAPSVSAAAEAAIVEDNAFIAGALERASVIALIMSVIHLTGDVSLLDEIPRTGVTTRNIDGDMTDADRAKIRARALEALCAYRDGRPMPPPPSAETLARMINFAAGQAVSPEYAQMMLEELHLTGDGRLEWAGGAPPKAAAQFHTLVIGAGMSGILGRGAARSRKAFPSR